jgi:hypothetical protein
MTMPRQQDLPHTEPKRDKEIASKAEAYVDARDAHRKTTTKLIEKKSALIEAMKKKHLETYNDGEFAITLESKDAVKVRDASESDDEGEEAAE